MMETVDFLAFGAHPDDVEIGMGGTIAKHAVQGYRIAVCDLTEAEMSSNGTVETRRQEAAEASAVLGLSHRSVLRLPDRGLTGSEEQLQAIVREIRRLRPRIVFAPYWDDRHPDHVACSRLIEEAVFNAKLRNYLPGVPPVQVEQLYYYFINDSGNVSLITDISDQIGTKLEALKAYRSQFAPPAPGEDRVQTPLTDRYIQRVEARDMLLGQTRGWAHAEGFAIRRPHAVTLF
ncbi:bacillithiol biosynthesis deacetylase BshB1 [Paenibacillus sacheonensis]|uniref:Bacillithiol biosynthesis deacetylase BshB1 n=1 Tax=Paenibacillus sacheonensis TaxID=742054 RepID=A0A7X4YMF6_9BACL|nr:bacillithiol biosynthesis deacetylase BshB1 [Paenibacillus sacheonensis]MBM7564521.1 bacillithiol biosynthesis deacetylase BshB1 [Paenibacillus sacheonensis]NBC69080.1 bacillithiol biosynthesis deacetylase BshB1 [Paenibacillus sacheonensis]